MLDLYNKTVLAFNDADMDKVYKLLAENNIDYEYASNYVVTSCPNCGDYEFWDGSHCNHCGYDL